MSYRIETTRRFEKEFKKLEMGHRREIYRK